MSGPSPASRRPTTSLTLTGRPTGPEVDVRDPAPVVVLVDRAGLGEVAQDLADEERVAGGLGQHRVAQRDAVLGHLVAGDLLEQRQQVVVASVPASAIRSTPRLAVQRGEELGERVTGGDLGVAERAEHAHAHRPGPRVTT